MQVHSRSTGRQLRSSLFLGALIGICIGGAFASGFLVRGLVDARPAIASDSAANSDYLLLNEVQSLLDQYFLHDQPTFAERQYAAIRGMLNTLNDHYTFFVDPPVAQSESDVLAGTYGGVGVQVQRSEDGKLLLFPFKESPAALAGIEDGDELIAINHLHVDITLQADVLDQKLRGEVKDGNGVTLTIVRAFNGEEVEQFVPYAVISVPSVVSRTIEYSPVIGYIQISLFTSRTPAELRDALNELKVQNVAGIILDLRNNSGGLLRESVNVASEFLNDGVIVYESSKDGEDSLNAEPGGVATQIPLVVIVNKGTASAAELVAGAIHDRGRGLLIGQTTYGKGSVQQIFRLSDGSSLHITAAEWLTPQHLHLDGVGLKPDVEMIPDVNGRDVEMGEAIRRLKSMLAS
ncbi:MAG: S41 family peptidase [Anaerolineae bacterium]